MLMPTCTSAIPVTGKRLIPNKKTAPKSNFFILLLLFVFFYRLFHNNLKYVNSLVIQQFQSNICTEDALPQLFQNHERNNILNTCMIPFLSIFQKLFDKSVIQGFVFLRVPLSPLFFDAHFFSIPIENAPFFWLCIMFVSANI